MGKDLEMTKSLKTNALLAVLFSLIMLRCGDEGQKKHYKFISAAERSPTAPSLMAISKEEYDIVEGATSGCGGVTEPNSPPTQTFELYLADTSGLILRQLTNNLELSTLAKIRFSPKGDKIMVWDTRVAGIVIVDTLGSTALGDSLTYTADAEWSPDGSKIVCSASTRSNIFTRLATINSDGKGYRRLIDSVQTGSVAWSSQNKIAFVFSAQGKTYLATINPDGSGLRTLDSLSLFYNTRWSPDGATLLYSAKDSSSWTVYRMDILTAHKQPLVQYVDDTRILSLRYSPDGTMISYYVYLNPNQFDLYVIQADGSNARHVASLSTDGSWSSDSRSLTYVYYNNVLTQTVR